MTNFKAINVSDLHPFPENPFKVHDDTEMEILIESIKEYGVITPLLVRPLDTGGFEIISGHRRMIACQKAGIEKVPAFVRPMERDAAVVALVDSNLHREHILPSEKAFAYKMKLEAIKHQGRTSPQVAEKLSVDYVGEADGVSGDTVWRYVRLTNLSPELLQLVDDGKIALSPAVALSYLAEKEQADLLETIESEECTPSLSQAQRIRKMSEAGTLDIDAIFSILTEVKPNQVEQMKFPIQKLRSYFPKDYPQKMIYEDVFKGLELLKKQRERNRDRYSR
jgi:ParB family chromosome partitioning protein